jgi:LmbE family N-acetylglucosaminyl deacetylase
VLQFALDSKKGRGMKVLCVGAHSDDIEIGCGGTILRLLSERGDVDVHWVVLGSEGDRDQEARTSADRFLAKARKKNIVVEHFKTSFFPYVGAVVKEFFERLKTSVSPDVIFTHNRQDLHQDHRVVSDLTWNTFRDHLILEYEILKYDGDLGRPNVFVHLDEDTCQKKVDLLMECFGTQRTKDWFTPDAFLALLRIRGVEARSPDKYAEAFYCRKAVLSGNGV